MFGKRKNENENKNDINEMPKNTIPAPGLKELLQADKSSIDAMRSASYATATKCSPLGFSPEIPAYGSYGAYLSEAHTVDKLLNIYKDLATAVMNVLEPEAAVARLTNVLENIKYPTDDCRACPYHIPGSVEHCDKNRFLAEYLVYKDFVKVNRPKQEAQEEK